MERSHVTRCRVESCHVARCHVARCHVARCHVVGFHVASRLGPAGQAGGANLLKQLASVIITITNNYKPKSGPIDHAKRFGLQQLQIITKQPFCRLAIRAGPETHLGPAGQAGGANPLKQLTSIITTITNNYKPKSGPIDHTKRFGLQQLQIITKQPFGRLGARPGLLTPERLPSDSTFDSRRSSMWRDVLWCELMCSDVMWRDAMLRDPTWRDPTSRTVTWRDGVWQDCMWRDPTWREPMSRDVACKVAMCREAMWRYAMWRDAMRRYSAWKDPMS